MKPANRTRWDMVVAFIIVVVGFLVWTAYASFHKTSAKPHDPHQQIVVWDTAKEGMPAHYVNNYDGTNYYTACGKQMYYMTSRSATIEITESEKRLTCDECRMALESYTKLRTEGDQRYIDIQGREIKILDQDIAEHKAAKAKARSATKK